MLRDLIHFTKPVLNSEKLISLADSYHGALKTQDASRYISIRAKALALEGSLLS